MVCRAPSEADLYELVVEDEAPNSDASAGIRAGMTRIDVLLHLRHSDPIPAGGRHGRAAAGGYPGTPHPPGGRRGQDHARAVDVDRRSGPEQPMRAFVKWCLSGGWAWAGGLVA